MCFTRREASLSKWLQLSRPVAWRSRFLVGEVDEKGKQLVKVTHDCWQAAIDYCKPGKPFNGIGSVIEDFIKPYGYSRQDRYLARAHPSIHPSILLTFYPSTLIL